MRGLASRRALAALAAGIFLIAGQATRGRAALIYDFTLGAGVQINDNLHLDPPSEEEGLRQPVEETIFTIRPGLTALWRAERDQLSLRYSGEYAMFQGDEERDPEWVHTVDAGLSWRRWAPFFLDAQEARARIPRTQETEGEAVVDQIDRNRVFVRSGLVSAGVRSTFELAYRGELVTYSGIDEAAGGAPEAAAASDDFDRVERHYGEALVRHRWNPLWSGEARVMYGTVDRELASDYTEFNVSGAADQRWSERLALRYRLEWVREEDDEAAEAGAAAEGEEPASPLESVRTHLLLGAEIRGELERGGSWRLAYQDGLADRPDGDTRETGRVSADVRLRARLGSTLDVGAWHESRQYRISGRDEEAWGSTLLVRWLVAPLAALDLGGSWTSTTIREEGLDEVEDRTTRASAGVVIMLFKRAQLEVGYGYRENDSAVALRRYANNLVFALLTVHFKPVESGVVPPSFAAGLVAGGAPSGGVEQRQ